MREPTAEQSSCSGPPQFRPWTEELAPWQHPLWHDRLEPLDSGGNAYYIRNFLSDAEVRAVLARAGGLRLPVRPHATAVISGWDNRGREIDPVLAAIEKRVGNLTGIAPHGKEGMPRVTLSRPWGDEHASTRCALKNLHHDQNSVADADGRRSRRERRAATVLVYLSGTEADAQAGGDTLFPCLRPRRPELCARLEAAFAREELELAMPDGMHGPLPSFDPDVARAASDMCLGNGEDANGDGGDGGALRIAPRRGAAAFFLSVERARPGVGLAHMWHGGCRVWRGEKWTLQLFKDLPG